MKKIKPVRYWKSKKICIDQIAKIIGKLKRFPTWRDVNRLGFSGLATAINKYHGGFPVLRVEMGYAEGWRPRGFFNEWANCESELAKVIAELKRFPTQVELGAMGLAGLAGAIGRCHGGISVVRARMGFKPTKLPDHHWCSWPVCRKTLTELAEKLKRFPTFNDLKQNGLLGLAIAIQRYHGNFPAVRERMGYGHKKRPHGYWHVWSNCSGALKNLERKLDRTPTLTDLTENGLGGLKDAIFKIHGGYPAVRVRMGYALVRQSQGFWQRWLNCKKGINAYISRFNMFPTVNDLRNNGYQSLCFAIIAYHGGFSAVRERMGYTPVNAEILKLHADGLVRALFALRKQLPDLKSDILWSAIKKKWYAPDLERALKKAKRGDLKAFRQLLAS